MQLNVREVLYGCDAGSESHGRHSAHECGGRADGFHSGANILTSYFGHCSRACASASLESRASTSSRLVTVLGRRP